MLPDSKYDKNLSFAVLSHQCWLAREDIKYHLRL